MTEKRINWPWSGWETVRRLGVGGYGAVFEIERDVFGQTEKAALKVLSIPNDPNEIHELREDGYNFESISQHYKKSLKELVQAYSLMQEMKGHTNIVCCDDLRYTQHDDGIGWDLYIKMELLTPLTQYLAKEYSENQTIQVGMDICNALILCAKANIIHRNIKPQNIFVSQTGDFKLGDFGIAKHSNRATKGNRIGTYEYIAPEIYQGMEYGSSADIYSLGLVMYWMMNKQHGPFLPVSDISPTESMRVEAGMRRFSGTILPLPANGSERLQRIVLKACAYSPQDRYVSAEEMLEDLRQLRHTISCVEDWHGAQTVILPYVNESFSKTLVMAQTQTDELLRRFNDAPDWKKNEKDSKNQWYLIFLVGIAVILILLAVYLLFSSEVDQQADKQMSDTKTATASIQASETEPKENPEDVAYRQATEYCAVAAPIDVITYLSEIIANGTADKRYNALLSEAKLQLKQDTLTSAKEYLENKKFVQALGAIQKVQPTFQCEEFDEMVREIHRVSSTHRIAAGRRYTGIINASGTVSLSGKSEKTPCYTTTWSDIVSIAIGDFHVLGLTASGTVVGTGPEMYYEGISEWQDIAVIAAGDGHSVGLSYDGHVYATGLSNAGQCDVQGLMTESPIVSVAAGYLHTVALHADGTVTAVGDNTKGQSAVSDWNEIVAIAAGSDHTLGLRADGTVVAAGSVQYQQTDTSEWKDIIAVAAGDYFSMGLRTDGTVVVIGENGAGKCSYSRWSDIIEIAGGNAIAIGLTASGILMSEGNAK